MLAHSTQPLVAGVSTGVRFRGVSRRHLKPTSLSGSVTDLLPSYDITDSILFLSFFCLFGQRLLTVQSSTHTQKHTHKKKLKTNHKKSYCFKTTTLHKFVFMCALYSCAAHRCTVCASLRVLACFRIISVCVPTCSHMGCVD